MTQHPVVSFVEVARSNDAIKAELSTANGPTAVVEIAAKLGFEFSEDELSATPFELDREELTSVAVRRAGFRVKQFGSKHWFGWK